MEKTNTILTKKLKLRSYKHIAIFILFTLIYLWDIYLISTEPENANNAMMQFDHILLIILLIARAGFHITHEKICELNLSDDILQWYLISTAFPTPWNRRTLTEYTDETIYKNVETIRKKLPNTGYYILYFLNMSIIATSAVRRYENDNM